MQPEIMGHFSVREKLGAGGMGEVYKAEDLKLHRYVALKFLPRGAAGGAVERFTREARAIAGLNHPNICTLYEFADEAGQPFLVMELLEGETLRERLLRKPLPGLNLLLEWAIQIADALEAAHRQGIVHRDLKPANLFITRHQQAKILDFGLARLQAGGETGLDEETASLTAPQLTSPGTTLGTIAYMSPEQARGEEVTAQSDLFSFGVVLYEAVTGHPCFQAKSTAETFSRILNLQPAPPTRLRPEMPAELERIILRALEKDPELRYQHASELRAELKRCQRDLLAANAAATAGGNPVIAAVGRMADSPENSRTGATRFDTPAAEASTGSGAASAATMAASADKPTAVSDSQIISALLSRHRRGLLWSGAGAITILAALAGWYSLASSRSRELATVVNAWRNAQVIELTHSGLVAAPVAISPDGNYVAYVRNSPQGESLWIRQVLASSGSQIVPPLSSPSAVFRYTGLSFTPDNSYVDYTAGSLIHPNLYQVPVLGGTPVELAKDVDSGPAFSPDGRKMAFVRCQPSGYQAQVVVAAADGSQARMLAQSQGPDFSFTCSAFSDLAQPAWSHNGRWIAVIAVSQRQVFSQQIAVISTRTGAIKLLPPTLGFAQGLQWLAKDNGLMVIGGRQNLVLAENHVLLVPYPHGAMEVLTHGLGPFNSLSLSADGKTLASQKETDYASIWLQRPGQAAQPIVAPANNYQGTSLAWAPQRRIAYMAENGNGQNAVFEVDPEHPGPPQQTSDSGNIAQLAVSSRGQIAYNQLRGGQPYLITQGGQQRHGIPLLAGGFPSFTPDGNSIVFIQLTPQQELAMIPAQGGRARVLAPYFAGVLFPPALSPDGRQILFETHDPKTGKMAAGIFPLAQPKQIAYLPIEKQMQWLPDGRGLSYVKTVNGVDNIWAAAWRGKPRAITHFRSQMIWSYAWSRGGRLAIARNEAHGSVVLLNATNTRY